MRTKVTLTLQDDGTTTMEVGGETLVQVVIGLLRFGQLQAEQEASLSLLLTKVESSPIIEEILKKVVSLQEEKNE